ncbi:hypothetical protein CDD83_1694 [Cordyceps sp. RAO-2017]|nr:hypothetical protein CDD83_1694 [Cordyceps sp. RAO-2017]
MAGVRLAEGRVPAPAAALELAWSGDDDDDDDTPLPFPAALPRSDFLAPDFQPVGYLSALPHRHQTLEDLRAELRERSGAISAELVELVNANYTAFLSLGSELRGGDDRVGGVRVALLGFRRAVDDLRAAVAARRRDACLLNCQLARLRADAARARALVDLADRLAVLEDRLALPLPGRDAGGDDDDDDDDSGGDDEDSDDPDEQLDGLLASSPAKLALSAKECSLIAAAAAALDQQQHPLAAKLQERITRCRNTLLLDLANALKEARGAGPRGHGRVLRYLEIYRVLDAQRDAVKALRNA